MDKSAVGYAMLVVSIILLLTFIFYFTINYMSNIYLPEQTKATILIILTMTYMSIVAALSWTVYSYLTTNR